MLRKAIASLLVLALLLTAVPALAERTYSASTPLTGSKQKMVNVILAANAINGTTIPYEGTFSFNQVVGPRTMERGYQTAPNGRGIDVTGGGVAQAATTLFLALLDVEGGIEYGPFLTYDASFTDSYVSDGALAIITDYNSGADFSFTNYGDPMKISMWVDGTQLNCSITTEQGAAADEPTTDTGTLDAMNWFSAPLAPGATAPPIASPTLLTSATLYCGYQENLIHNVTLAAGSVNDTVLTSGGTFSFNDVVGPRTKEYGYRSAINGRGAKVTGGGVAQVASVIWLAIKNQPEFSVVEKSTYGKKYNQQYVSSSSDAILTDYKAGRDFSFRYTGQGSVTINCRVENNVLTCEIYRN